MLPSPKPIPTTSTQSSNSLKTQSTPSSVPTSTIESLQTPPTESSARLNQTTRPESTWWRWKITKEKNSSTHPGENHSESRITRTWSKQKSSSKSLIESSENSLSSIHEPTSTQSTTLAEREEWLKERIRDGTMPTQFTLMTWLSRSRSTRITLRLTCRTTVKTKDLRSSLIGKSYYQIRDTTSTNLTSNKPILAILKTIKPPTSRRKYSNSSTEEHSTPNKTTIEEMPAWSKSKRRDSTIRNT